MRLSKRLLALARLVKAGSRVADIGTDHGYLPAYLLSEGISPQVYCCDIHPLPLERAAQTFSASALFEGVSFRCADGLLGLDSSDTDVIVIAGMGGDLIAKILTNGFFDGKHYQDKVFLLQPMTKAEKLREYLAKAGFVRENEQLVEEDKKIFLIMQCTFDGKEKTISPEDAYFGKDHLQTPSELADRYLLNCCARLKKAANGKKRGGRSSEYEDRLLAACHTYRKTRNEK